MILFYFFKENIKMEKNQNKLANYAIELIRDKKKPQFFYFNITNAVTKNYIAKIIPIIHQHLLGSPDHIQNKRFPFL